MPTTSAPWSAMARVTRPWPQPRSQIRSPVTSPISDSTARKKSSSGIELWPIQVSYHSAISSYALAPTARLLRDLRQAQRLPDNPAYFPKMYLDKLTGDRLEQSIARDIP